jgi:drug/metabolite transporter (DMT)-like permease
VTELAEPIPGIPAARHRRVALGYTIYAVAALLFAINGTVSKSILLTGISAARLTELRVTAAFLILFVIIALTRRAALRIRRDEIALLLAFGILGIAMTQWLFFLALERLAVGVALIIEFTAPIMVALWFRFGRREQVRPTVWVGLGLALAGLVLVAQVWQGFSLDVLGVAAALGAAAALAVYYILAEHQVHRPNGRDAVSLTMWGFGAAALFFAIIQPWWSFPWADLAGTGQPLGADGPAVPIAALTTWMIVLGTVAPFWLVVASLHHITSAQASTIGMMEPVLASIVAWLALSEILTPIQIIGGVVVLAGVYLAERSR